MSYRLANKPPRGSPLARISSIGELDTTEMSSVFGGGAASAAAAANPTQGDLKSDVQVQNGPEDSISDLRFSSASEHLAVASWDKKVRIYEVDGNGNTQGKALFEHEAPVLSCCWSTVQHTSNTAAAYKRTNVCIGRSKGLWRRCRQSCSHARSWSWLDPSTASGRTRPADQMRRVDHGEQRTYAHHRLVG